MGKVSTFDDALLEAVRPTVTSLATRLNPSATQLYSALYVETRVDPAGTDVWHSDFLPQLVLGSVGFGEWAIP